MTDYTPGIIHATTEEILGYQKTGLLCDREIAKLAQEGMISPFESSTDGDGAISYGLSSFSYDARLDNQFRVVRTDLKIEPNSVNPVSYTGRHIDPKQIDADLFRLYVNDSLYLPPNGFTLACTQESFAIPKDILVTCMSKSTYARCFSGDTQVALYDGTSISFYDLAQAQIADPTKTYYGVVLSTNGDIINAPLTAARKVGTESVLLVTLSDGSSFSVTPDHTFYEVADDGTLSTTAAQDLQDVSNLKQFRYNSCNALSIVSITPQQTPIDVYCLTVPTYGNFALANGLFVSNCGIQVEVTPLQPAWYGQLTLEISNSTPVPAKLYAGEGICQFHFWAGGVTPDQSYFDRGGKYLGQKGVVLPKLAR